MNDPRGNKLDGFFPIQTSETNQHGTEAKRSLKGARLEQIPKFEVRTLAQMTILDLSQNCLKKIDIESNITAISVSFLNFSPSQEW